MRRFGFCSPLLGCVAGAAVVSFAAPALAATHEVGANGNPFTGGLSFTPALVDAKVGDIVRWTNTDPYVPHTATERNGLWNLTGTYGDTPLNPPGFGPGETRERIFEAGSFDYFCEVHPEDMTGLVAVPPKLHRERSEDRVRLELVWATVAPTEGQAFDVQRRRKGAWKTVREGTTKLSGRFRGRHGEFRARLRLADDLSKASGWSPTVER